MRSFFLALASAGGLAMAGLAPAHAAGTRYPVCIQGDEYPGLSGCTFTSFQQCQATASGRFLTVSPIPTTPAVAAANPVSIASVGHPRAIPIHAIERERSAENMRKSVLTLVAFGVACAIDVAPAVAGGMAFCIKGCDFGGGAGDCSFSSYQQCRATAAGRDATCAANPYFSQSADLQSNRSSRRRY